MLTWHSETLDADGWRDIDQLAAHLEGHQLRDDVGKIMQGAGANGTVQGYLGSRTQNMTNMQWGARGDQTPHNPLLRPRVRQWGPPDQRAPGHLAGPADVDPNALPNGIAVHPCPGRPDRVVLVADLNRVTNDPESVVADLIAAEDAINQVVSG